MDVTLTNEQRFFVESALSGSHILVDACIGSGKTTSIQTLCEILADNGKRVLYLTYNKLLKLDARERIRIPGVTVTNYHGFAYTELRRTGNPVAGIGDLIQSYNRYRPVCRYDVLVIDEYQDIEQETAEMLQNIKNCNPAIQLIAVGDMEQKIYDKTNLDVAKFMDGFLRDAGGNYMRLEFTRCFRLSQKHAAMLGRVWEKNITGVNDACEVKKISFQKAFRKLKKCEPSQVLCLGANGGDRDRMLNLLEERCPDTYNKHTVWANTADRDTTATSPEPACAIFTTYDGCKGMERDVCFVFDFTPDYWLIRLRQPETKYAILRNIFCVAASRGKRKIYFVVPEGRTKESILREKTLRTVFRENVTFEDMNISQMFDFKYREDVEAAYDELSVRQVIPPGEIIDIPVSDGLIDVSPCIGTLTECVYFKNTDVMRYIQAWANGNRGKTYSLPSEEVMSHWSLDYRILYLTALETSQARYRHQVRCPLADADDRNRIRQRLSERLPDDASTQVECHIPFREYGFCANGFADVVHDNGTGEPSVYELKFVSELSHSHFLQCACYMVALGIRTGYLWNIRDGQMYRIEIPDRRAFMDRVAIAITKRFAMGSGAGKKKKKKTGK